MHEIHIFDEQLEQLVAKMWDGLSVYTAAGESLNVGNFLTSYIAEVGIRKVSQGGGSWQQVGDYKDHNFEIEDTCLIQPSQEL